MKINSSLKYRNICGEISPKKSSYCCIGTTYRRFFPASSISDSIENKTKVGGSSLKLSMPKLSKSLCIKKVQAMYKLTTCDLNNVMHLRPNTGMGSLIQDVGIA